MTAEHGGLPRWAEVPLAAFTLLLAAPLLIIVAVLVGLTSPGGPLFRQKRIGRHGEPFVLVKVRTMMASDAGPRVTAATDTRITPEIGSILRRFKIDELPGLWNVLTGDMSLVGPRPEVPELVDLADERWQSVLHARPGLTDPTTLRFRDEEQMLAHADSSTEEYYRRVIQPLKLAGYIAYLQTRTSWTDIVVILNTIRSIAFHHADGPPGIDSLRQPPAH